MPWNIRLVLISTMICVLSGTALGDEAPPSAQAIAGQYAMGDGPSVIFLSLLPEGKFVMRSGRPLGDQIGGQLEGAWELRSSQVVMWSTLPGHPFSWLLQAVPHADAFDLVPVELANLYRQEPSSRGTRYRRYAGPSADDERMLAQASATPSPSVDPNQLGRKTNPASSSRRTIASARTVSGAAKSDRSDERPHSSSAKVRAPLRPARESTAPRPVVAYKRDAPVFIYRPAPTDQIDVGSLGGPGLARLSTDVRGNVTSVTILQSTGQRQFDDEAADTLRRWRVKAGPAREIEVSLISVLRGKRAPVRIPLKEGSMTSG